jgi:hypothetical protein
MIAVPATIPLTIAVLLMDGVTVATERSDETHGLVVEEAVGEPVNVMLLPTQTDVDPPMVGKGLTVTVTEVEVAQPVAVVVPVTVYCVLVVGFTVIELAVEPIGTPEEDHTYVSAPDAVSVEDPCPVQMEVGEAVSVTEGLGLTVTVAVVLQPLISM